MNRFGPGALVAAAFIGPGTVTTCYLAGVDFGTSLFWALIFATAATIVLQEMAARLGSAGQTGLGEALLKTARPGPLRWGVGALLIAAIAVGNAAYEGGNLAGGALGAEALIGTETVSPRLIVVMLGLAAGVALIFGNYRSLETLLIALVGLMSGAFLVALVLARPDLSSVISGIRPKIPDGGALVTVALIGTTIVPYNLFLHAAASRERFSGADGVSAARTDTAVAIAVGGLVSCAILLVASQVQGSASTTNIALALEPTLGTAGRFVVGIGLLAAGFTSAVTAPMATGFVVSEIVGGEAEKRRKVFRIGAISVLIVGTIVASRGVRPTELILVAQAANGILLPVVAVYLMVVMNQRSVLGDNVNGILTNALGLVVVSVAIFLGGFAIGRVLGIVT
ncbi:MAG: divalent metal cation transporter [Pseudomonadota bacterium]